MSRRVVIVGAGPGGLAAAMLMARAGADVTVLERHDRVGGRSATVSTPGGYRFDLGPTFFLFPGILRDLFDACGRDLDREVELARVDPLYRIVFEGGGELELCADPQGLAREVARLCPEDAANLPRFMAENRRKLAAFAPILGRPFRSAADLLHPSVLRALPLLRPHCSLDGDLARWFSDPRVRLAFSFQSKYLGMSPFRCPSLFSILSFMEHEHGVWHPIGGCGAVMEAMARVATDLGARIRLGETVREIQWSGRRAVGVRTDAGDHPCDALVLNADFANAMASLVPDRLRRRWTDRSLERKKFSCSTFMLYLGIEGRLPDLSHHTILLARDYRRNIRDIEEGTALPDEPSLYVQNACVTDPHQAPPGHSTLYVLVPVGNLAGGVDWSRERARYRDLVIERLKRLGIDLDGRIRYERVTTPADWAAEMNVFRGATFNLAHSLDQMLHRRPQNRFEDLDRVFLVGGGTHPGSGLPVIFEGARITSGLIADELGLVRAWRGWADGIPGRSALVEEGTT
ncbi:MAG TPA: phytoene desaturase family protein [Arenibaculum sp.]|nr:phytoene desaturase family protein [Arenibaculum sp.]